MLRETCRIPADLVTGCLSGSNCFVWVWLWLSVFSAWLCVGWVSRVITLSRTVGCTPSRCVTVKNDLSRSHRSQPHPLSWTAELSQHTQMKQQLLGVFVLQGAVFFHAVWQLRQLSDSIRSVRGEAPPPAQMGFLLSLLLPFPPLFTPMPVLSADALHVWTAIGCVQRGEKSQARA